MGRALIVLCTLLCLFVLSARSELNVPWPPSNPPDCSSATWDFEGEAYAFCHMTFTGSHNDNEWDGESVSEVIEPCNFHYFKIDAATYPGGVEVGDWLEVRLDYTTNNDTAAELSLLGRWEDLPTQENNDFEYAASASGNVSISISPYYVSFYSTIWLAVGGFDRHDTNTDPADYTLSVTRYRPSQDCGDCICDPTFGNTEIDLETTNADEHIVTQGNFVSDFNDTRPFLLDADDTYQRMRNFHFAVDSSLYRPGAYIDVNITVHNGSSSIANAYLSAGPYAVDPRTDNAGNHAANHSYADTGALATDPCVNGDEVSGQNNHLIRVPCDFYYGDYYLTLLFVSSGCVDGATYEIIVTVYAPIVNQLSVNTQFTNNLQDNIFLGGQASYSQFDHYSLVVTGTTGRTHAFARLTSVYGAQLGLFMRTSDQTDNNIVYGDRDRTLVPYTFGYDEDACEDDCYATPYSCQTGVSGDQDGSCGCYFIVPSCAFADDTYYLSVVPGTHDGDYYVDGNSYHLEVDLYEDSVSVALAPGEPVVATLAVWTPFQAYTFATPNAVDTWAIVELFVRAPSTENNQLGQPSLTLSLQQDAPYDVCTGTDDYYKTCTTDNFFTGAVDGGYGLSPTACNIFVDTCRLNSGPIYLVVYNDDEPNDIAPFGVTGGHWDYVLWADLENPWALEADVTYTDRIHGNFYNHYYIDVDDSIEAGSWLSVDFENIFWLDDAISIDFAAYLNYESLAGECPCYEYVDVCQISTSSGKEESCEEGEACSTDVNGWNNEYGFDLPDNTYPVESEYNHFSSASCRVQATTCIFRPGRWYVSTKATGCKSEPAREGHNLIGYTVTAHIYDAPVVHELEFNEQITEQLEGSEIRHYQLTNLEAAGDDLVISVAWYQEVLSRFYSALTAVTGTFPKAYTEDWGVEVRLAFGELAFEECYEHPWSCKASFKNGGSCQIIVPVCKWAQVDPEQIFISVRYDRGLNDTEESVYQGYQGQLSGYSLDPLDVLAPEFWVGAAQFNLLVSSERAEVTALAVGTPVYGSVKKDRYAHYSLQLLQTQGLRTDIDIYYNVQTAYDLSFESVEPYFPILALNQGSLAGNGRGCRDCFTAARSCQNDAACHWTFDSCDSLEIDTTYYLSVYKPANAFYDQALEFALSVSQEDLVIPFDLTSEGRLTSTIKLQDSFTTRAFFELDGSSLAPRQSPYDALYITVWANGAYDANFTAYLNHGGLAGACPCYGRICQQDLNLTSECPIAYHGDSDDDYRGALVDYSLEAGAYFLTFEFPGVVGSDAVVLTVEANAIYYPVYEITPTNLRESGTEFWLGDFDLPYGEILGDDDSGTDFDYNAGYNMDNWLIDNAGHIDWDLGNVFRNHVLNPVNFVQRYRITPPSRLDDLNWQNLNFYAVQITSRNDIPGYPMPDRAYVGIDNIHTDHDNCQNAHGLFLHWYGTDDRAINPFLTSTVLDETRTTCSSVEDIDSIIETFIARTGDGLLFSELPPCLFTHAGTAVHYFGVEATRFQGWDLELSDVDDFSLRGSVYYDIRFWIQKPIVLENIDAFYTGASFGTVTANPPYTTNWQPFRSNSVTLGSDDFKQRFELDLTAEIAGMDAPFVQVVIEHEFDELTVTVNGDYAPNFVLEECLFDSCTLRSVLEVRGGSLSAVQLPNTAVADDLDAGSSYLASNAANSQNFKIPTAGTLEYTLAANQSFVFTLDPCALKQSSDWFFDIKSTSSSNASFWVYYTDAIDLLDANVIDITVSDVELRDWVPNTDSASLSGLDDYTFIRLNVDDLDLFADGLGRPRLEIQIDWLPQFDTDIFSGALNQAAAIVISRDAPLFLKGEDENSWPFPTSTAGTNFAVLTDDLDDDFDLLSFDSHIDVCTAAFYLSTVGLGYNATNAAARNSGRFFLDGCDLAGTSEIWITARMLTVGYRDFEVLARVVADQIGTTDIVIADGYPDVAQVNIQSDTEDAIEPHSFNHHSFQLPADLLTDSSVQSTLIVELKFPDDDIDRYNGTFYLLFSADAPAGFAGSLTPDNYVASFGNDYDETVYYNLNTFGEQSAFLTTGTALFDCYTNFIDYTASPLSFDDDDTGIVPVGDFITEYRTRRNIDLFEFRYASTLWVSIYFDAPVWEELDPQEEDDELGWQGYELRVWLQDEPGNDPIQIERNNSAGTNLCWEVSTNTGVDANAFDYNITWGESSLTPTWFAFELTEDLVSLDCSDLETDECLFSQWLEFQIFNDWLDSDGFVQDYTYGTTGYPEIYIQDNYTVYGPARFSVGGSGDMYSSSVGNDIVGGEWTIHDSHLSSDRRLGQYLELVAVNQSSQVSQFFPCSGFNGQGQGYGVDTDWIFNSEFYAHTAIMSLRPGTYYIPVWSADSVDFTICASLNSFGYDTTWINPTSPYIPREIDIDENAASDEAVAVLAQILSVEPVSSGGRTFEYYWFHLDDSQFDQRDYLQIWLDQVLLCNSTSTPAACSALPSDDTIILQMFRSDCQLWTCQADGTGAGCEGRINIGAPDLDNTDFYYDEVSRFVLGGAGLSPCSLTSGDFFIKVSLPGEATYSLSVYLRTPPATFVLPDAVAIRSTIFQSAFQHYSYSAADTETALLTFVEVSLTEVGCGLLELFAKHGTPAGPFYPTTLDRNTFIGSQMYNPSTFGSGLGFPFSSVPRNGASSLEKCASAYCVTGNTAGVNNSCSIQLGTTELSKDLAGSIGSTTWFFAVRVLQSDYTTDNDEADVLTGTTATTIYGDGFFEPVTYFITAAASYTEVTHNVQWGCPVSFDESPAACGVDVVVDPNPPAQVYQFGFQTVGLFTDIYVKVNSGSHTYFLNATVQDHSKPDGVNQYVEPVLSESDWAWRRFVSYDNDATTDLDFDSSVVSAGPKNIFVNLDGDSSLSADFFHYPVPLIAPGVAYSGAGLATGGYIGNRYILSHYVIYEFSPALTSAPLFALTTTADDGINTCLEPMFWYQSDCGSYYSEAPSTEDLLDACGYYPRFLTLRLDDSCSASCSSLSCDDVFRWELGYQTSLPITDLLLNVESCGADWETVQFAEALIEDDSEYVIFSLPVDVDPSTATEASWLALDFYPSLSDDVSNVDIYLFESSALDCFDSASSYRDNYFELQNAFFCPENAYMVVSTSSFLLDYTASAITASNFKIPVVDFGSLDTAVPGSTLSVIATFADFTQYDLFYSYAVYSFTIPDSLVTSVSRLSVDVEETDSCVNLNNWWLNFGSPVPAYCADLSNYLEACEVTAGTYFISLQLNPYDSDEAFPEFSVTISVSLDVFDVLAVPESGDFSATFTIEPFQTIVLQTSLSQDWLSAHPALQNEVLYRVTSPLGTITQRGLYADSQSNCFDCLAPVFSAEFTNNFETPFDIIVQFELMSDLLLNFDPSSIFIQYFYNFDISNVQAPLQFFSSYQAILAPYFDQRSLTINSLVLGTPVTATLYNAFTYRQLQVYLVSTVAANAIGQIRVSDVTGGLVSLQVYPATLLGSDCGEFKECHSAPLQWSDDHGLLQANPLNNMAGSCSLVYSPCEWSSYPSYFVVIHDHVFNAPEVEGEVYVSPFHSPAFDDFNVGYSNDNTTNFEPSSFGCFGFGCHQMTPTQDNPFVATQFTLTASEEFYFTESFPTDAQTFSTRPESLTSERAADNAPGNWQHFFYSYEASGVTSLVISVDVSASAALATSGVYVTVSDSDCGCSSFVRNIWCSAEYPSWLCEIEIPTHADHPLTSTTFYIDVYGLKGRFSLDVSEGFDNCVWSEGQDFCPTRVLNYAFWPTVPSDELDGKASCLYTELLSYFEEPACDDCLYDIPDECKVALQDYACAATFNPCDVAGFIDATVCVDKCTAVEDACPYSFVEAGLPNLDCGHPRYSSSNCFF